jgi:hypothetical protein
MLLNLWWLNVNTVEESNAEQRNFERRIAASDSVPFFLNSLFYFVPFLRFWCILSAKWQ